MTVQPINHIEIHQAKTAIIAQLQYATQLEQQAADLLRKAAGVRCEAIEKSESLIGGLVGRSVELETKLSDAHSQISLLQTRHNSAETEIARLQLTGGPRGGILPSGAGA